MPVKNNTIAGSAPHKERRADAYEPSKAR